MSDRPMLWLRRESAATEQRTPVVPADASMLIEAGVAIAVERSEHRVFSDAEYAAAGCRIVAADTWPDAPPDAYVLGLRRPSPRVWALAGQHLFFGHAFKGQDGAAELLSRFMAGAGTLYDLESLADEHGGRLASFGYWAGYAGAALGLLHHGGQLAGALYSTSRSTLDARLRGLGSTARVLVIGACGRAGRGACESLAVARVPTTCWDVEQTEALDREALLAHEVLVNAVQSDGSGPPFLATGDLVGTDRALRTVVDVTCDVDSDRNRLPVNREATTWTRPARRVHTGPAPVDVLALDNLPSLLPREASETFSGALVPLLRQLGGDDPTWQRSRGAFHDAMQRLRRGEEAVT